MTTVETQPLARLKLFEGNCPNDGVREGRFDYSSKENREILRINHAQEVVKKYLEYWLKDNDFWVQVVSFRDPLVNSESDARMLISHAATVWPGSYENLILYSSMHGRIIFTRYINFPGAVENQKTQLLDLIKSTKYQPVDPIADREFKFYENVPPGTFTPQWIQERKAEFKNRLWITNLSFT
jgi:hypothetical protein